MDIARRYMPFVTCAFRNFVKGKTKMVVRFTMCFLFMLIFIEFWRLIDREDYFDIPYHITDIFWYVSLTQMFFFLSPRLFMVIEDDVKNGDIAYFLIRPVSYIKVRFLEGMGMLMGNCAMYFTLGIFGLWLYIGAFPTGGITALLSALILVFCASLMHILMQLITGVSAFWLQESEPLYRIYQKFMIVLGGLYMPLSLYPEWFQNIAIFTPMYAMVYLPCQMVLSPHEPLLITLGLMAFWCVVIILCLNWVFRICVRKLEVNGG